MFEMCKKRNEQNQNCMMVEHYMVGTFFVSFFIVEASFIIIILYFAGE